MEMFVQFVQLGFSKKYFETCFHLVIHFSSCFENDLAFEDQAKNWKQVLKDYFFKAFKKVRLTNKQKVKNSEMNDLLHRRKKLKSKQNVTEKDDEEIENIEETIAEIVQEANRRKVLETFGEIDGVDGNLIHQGVWKARAETIS